MNVRKFNGSRALALILAMTIVMMYSVTITSFADINDAKVHYKGTVAIGDKIVISTTVGGVNYIAECSYVSGFNYVGAFYVGTTKTALDVENKFKLDPNNTNIYIKNTGQVLDLDKSSATGGNSLNVFVYEGSVSPYYDLGITKTVNDTNVMLGDEITFTIGITNDSTISVSGVYAEDVWPLGLSQGAVTADVGTSFNTADNSWTVGVLEARETKLLTIAAITTSIGSITNTINIGNECLEGDTNSDNDSDSATVRVSEGTMPAYDLGITKVVDQISVPLGSEATYTITVMNSSNSEITVEGIYADDIWPEGLSISGVIAEEGTSYDGSWHIGTLIPGQSKVLTISAITTTLGSITNTIEIGSDRPYGDTNTDNDSDSATIRVYDPTAPRNDLGITKTANPTSMLVGASLDFVVMITNHGTTEAYDIDVEDTWPAGVSLSGVAVEDGTTIAGMIWSIESLEPGESKKLTFSALTTAIGTFENGVEIIYADWWQVSIPDNDFEVMQIEGYHDANMLNNTASAIITVIAQTTTTTTTRTPRTPPTVIVEPEIPLAEEPVVTPIILEEPTPLADVVPQTSDTGNIWLLLGLMLGSGAGITALGRRKETAGK